MGTYNSLPNNNDCGQQILLTWQCGKFVSIKSVIQIGLHNPVMMISCFSLQIHYIQAVIFVQNLEFVQKYKI